MLEAANAALQQKNSNLQQDLDSQQEQKKMVIHVSNILSLQCTYKYTKIE